ncbi:MAG TPA: hypothetical protein ENN67_03065 [Firmicutes bacterium]|nr:hypothetical protein [Bacillota bacterium]
MSFCPSCSHENKSGAKKCRECGGKLVNGKTNNCSVKYKGRKWTLIRTVTDSDQASLIKSHLEKRGYEVAVRNGDGKLSKIIKDNSRKKLTYDIMVPEEEARESAKALHTIKSLVEEETKDFLPEDFFNEPVDYDWDDDRSYLESTGIIACMDDDDYY